jgi:hypothetical protein
MHYINTITNKKQMLLIKIKKSIKEIKMAKKGLRNGTPAITSAISVSALRKQMKDQSRNVQSGAYAASLNTSDRPTQRKFRMTYINGIQVKQFLS